MRRWIQLGCGCALAAMAAAGLWSSVHEMSRINGALHEHPTWSMFLAPHHVVIILAPLSPVLLLILAALRSRRSSVGGPVIRAREFAFAVAGLELAEVTSGSMAHGWLLAATLVVVAAAVGWMLGRLAVRVVDAWRKRRAAPHQVRSQIPTFVYVSVDTSHPSRVWLARNARRGPPVTLTT